MKKLLYKVLDRIAGRQHFHFFLLLSKKLNIFKQKYYTIRISKEFAECGEKCIIGHFRRLYGGKFITIGNDTKIGEDHILTAWDKISSYTFSPRIKIGNNCNIGEFCHITAVNSITIGNGVLTGRWVTITDNSHGNSTYEELQIPPLERKVFSKGSVVIGDNVWIGDKATILPAVTIGKGSIIAANAVVSRDIPANVIAGGCPAKVIKQFKNNIEI